MTDPKRFSDDSEIKLDLLRKVSEIENTIIDLKDKTQELRTEYDNICAQLEELLKHLDSN
jgi:hypothetical protein